MMMASGGSRVEDVEVLRADAGLLRSLGWDDMVCADTVLNFIGSRRNNGRNRLVNEALAIKAMGMVKEKQFSALVGVIAERGIINTIDYRPGNISPATGILSQLRKACRQAKEGGKGLNGLGSDSAAYQSGLMTFRDVEGIDYYISID